MTDYEILRHRFSAENIHTSTGRLAKQVGLTRQQYEMACERALAQEKDILEAARTGIHRSNGPGVNIPTDEDEKAKETQNTASQDDDEAKEFVRLFIERCRLYNQHRRRVVSDKQEVEMDEAVLVLANMVGAVNGMQVTAKMFGYQLEYHTDDDGYITTVKSGDTELPVPLGLVDEKF